MQPQWILPFPAPAPVVSFGRATLCRLHPRSLSPFRGPHSRKPSAVQTRLQAALELPRRAVLRLPAFLEPSPA